ncbi:MAG: hypothetical protein QXG10_01650 [Candidatus Hadarchaeales archaeon]
MKYGRFSKDNYEYIINRPDLPAPWVNFLTNEKYCAVISHTGGGYSFYKDPKTDRILYWVGRDLWTDRPGRYVFIRDRDSGEVFSITWQPLRRALDKFEARVGLGYQVISSSSGGIYGEVTYFVPRVDTCEIWRVRIKNKSKKKRNLSVFSYLEWMLGDNVEMNFHNIAILYNRAWFEKNANAIFAKKTLVFGQAVYEQLPVSSNPLIAFIGTPSKVDGWDCHKHKFLGLYNNEEKPESIFRGKCNQSLCEGNEAIGVLQHNIALAPGEERIIVFVVGETEGEEKAVMTLKKYYDLKNVESELDEVKKTWRERLGKIAVSTPDSDFDIMANIWTKYQLYVCNYWSRSPSYYHEGQGGRGYRDSCQDAQALLAVDVLHAREKLLKIASIIRRDGTCAPGWSDTYGPFPQKPYKDHPIWFTPSVASYVKETGDVNFLMQKAPWLRDAWRMGGTIRDPNWHKGATEDGEGTIFEHMLAQLNYTFNDVSDHGLPRIGEADWNDALDMVGRRGVGESVWLAMALVRSLKIAADLAVLINEKEISTDLIKKADEMTRRINKVGWDGEWYLRGFTDDGEPFGSSANKEGKIYLNPQSWAILSGVVPPERIKKLTASVDKYLEKDNGLVLFYPAYTSTDPRIGRITAFARGTKENAAIFCHANAFMIAADCMLGRGDVAYRRLCKIMPCKQEQRRYKAEPYVFAEYLIGPEHPYDSGRGAYTWVTGTAGWSFQVMCEHMLGVKPDYQGLRIDPCIPSKWKKCSITRPFRGASYNISIENPSGVQRGVKEIHVDGEELEGNIIMPHRDGKVHSVRVLMG